MLEAKAKTGALPDGLDPLALYLHLTGGRPDTMLFERRGAASLLLAGAAVRLVCRGRTVVATAIGEEGPKALAALAEALPDALVERSCDVALFEFPPIEAVQPAERLTAPSPFDALRALTAGAGDAPAEPFALAALGVIAFDHVDLLEELPANKEDPLGFPDLLIWLAEDLVVIEADGRARAVCASLGDEAAAERRLEKLVESCATLPPLARPNSPGEADFGQVDLDDEEYEDVVRGMKEHILTGDVYQIVASRTFRAPCPDPAASFAAQRHCDPSPYQFYVSAPDHVLFGCSPETSVRVDADGEVEIKPIAGTRPRGATIDEDDRLEAELRLDEKEVAEHMMLVDLARNDVARVSVPGTRRVARLLDVERYARVMHLVSSVTGRLRRGYDAVHALQACLNVGTLSGAPKLRAIELLRETERTKRGPYGGAVGWMNSAGALDTGVIIRSAVVKDGIAFVRAGAGIVHDSNPAAESDETKRKASSILSVLAGQPAS